jgi:hypothetical protein
MTYLMFVLVLAAYIGRQHKFSCASAGKREDAARPAVDRTQKKCYKHWNGKNKMKLSGGESKSNPGLLRVGLLNDKQKC